jgi:hypothetical protein
MSKLLYTTAAIGLLFLFALAVWMFVEARSTSERGVFSEPVVVNLASAKSFPETDVLPHLDGPIVPGRNYIYCATFQLAWNRLSTINSGGPLKLSGTSAIANALGLGSVLSEIVLPRNSYLLETGLVGDGVIDEISNRMKEQFNCSDVLLPKNLESRATVVYCYLQFDLTFHEAFEKLDRSLNFPNTTGVASVACFGVDHLKLGSNHDDALAKQVSVLSYISDNDFTVRLANTSEDSEIILAKIPREKTLVATLAALEARINQGDGHTNEPDKLLVGETLAIPIIDLAVCRRYSELEGRKIMNTHSRNLILAAAQQDIRFRLDQGGARLQSASNVAMTSSLRSTPRAYIFDKPFLVLLKRKSMKQPFFAAWIETAELLRRKKIP